MKAYSQELNYENEKLTLENAMLKCLLKKTTNPFFSDKKSGSFIGATCSVEGQLVWLQSWRLESLECLAKELRKSKGISPFRFVELGVSDFGAVRELRLVDPNKLKDEGEE